MRTKEPITLRRAILGWFFVCTVAALAVLVVACGDEAEDCQYLGSCPPDGGADSGDGSTEAGDGGG
jgi:hypothetical protein